MDVEALVKRLRYGVPAYVDRGPGGDLSNSRFDIVGANKCMEDAAAALAALSADLSMANAAAETARASSDHWEARAKEMEKERDDIKATLKYCEGCWSDERGTMIDMMKAAKARVAELERDSNRWWKCGVRDKARAEAAEARATTLAAEVERMRKALLKIQDGDQMLGIDASGRAERQIRFDGPWAAIARAALEGKDNDRHC
jgi:hypothetical protein